MVHSQTVNSTLTKQINERVVLQLIQGHGPIARTDIARITGLSPAAISGITGSLLKSGFVQSVGEGDSEGRSGRKSILLKLDPNAGHVIGVMLSVRTISCVITNLEATVLAAIEEPIPCVSDGDNQIFSPKKVMRATIRLIERLLASSKLKHGALCGIGVDINGIVDKEQGTSVHAPHFGWHNVPISAPLSEHFGVPVFLENDTRALTIAEIWFGAGRKSGHFVKVAAGFGIGAGVVIDGRIYRGSAGGAGEFGHICLKPGGDKCHCGKRGCLETLSSYPAIVQQMRKALEAGEASSLAGETAIDYQMIAAAAAAGDGLARRLLAEAGRWLGAGLACLVNVLNPQLIVINGEVVCFGRWYLEPMEAAMRELAFDGLASQLQLVVEPPGNEMWARGAACVMLGELFSSPLPAPAEMPVVQSRALSGALRSGR